MTRNELLNRYVKWGFTILPVVAGTKRPAVNWKEYQTKKPTREQLREWFADPTVGVGLVTGSASGVIVVDEDSYKKQGKILGLDTPLRVRTGRGGTHYYFKNKDGVTNSVNATSAVDTRGEGGFTVLPPTIHPDTAQAYEWLGDLPDSLDQLPTLDESFADELVKKQSSGERIVISDYLNLEEGSRDDSLLRVALSIVNKVPEAEAWILINSVNNSFAPPLPDRDVERIFRQAIRFVKTNPKKTADELKKDQATPLEVVAFPEVFNRYNSLMDKYGTGTTTGYKALDKYFKFIPTQLYMLSASTHSGKTTLLLNMAGRIARSGVKVCVASLEQGYFIAPRLASMFGSRDGLDENLTVIAPSKMSTPEDFLKTFDEVANRPKLLMIDHLHYFERGNRGATEEMDRLVVALQMLANQLEIPILVVAHLRKLNGAEKDKIPSMDDLKDSSSLSQIPGVVMLMHRKKSEELAIQAGAGIFSNKGTLFINKNRVFGQTGNLDFTLYDNGEIVFDDEPTDKVNPIATEIAGLEGLDW